MGGAFGHDDPGTLHRLDLRFRVALAAGDDGARVPHAPSFLLPDMTVSVDLTVAQRQRALVVPSDAVRDAATPTPWLFTVEGGRLVRKDVKLGIRGEGATEITEGVAEGTTVVLPDGQLLQPGQRVRTERE